MADSGNGDKGEQKQKIGRAMSLLVAGDAIAAIWHASTQPTMDGARATWSMIQGLWHSDQDYRVLSKETEPERRFAAAMRQGGVSDETIAWRIRHSARMFNALLICLAMMCAAMIVMFPGLAAQKIVLIPFVVTSLCGVAIPTAMLVKWGFWNYQLRSRALHGIGAYLSRPREWFPVSVARPAPRIYSEKETQAILVTANAKIIMRPDGEGGHGLKSGGVAALVLAVGLALGAAPAAAQTSSVAAAASASSGSCASGTDYVMSTFSLPCSQDVYRNALETIFPNVGPLTEPSIVMGSNGYASDSNGQSAVAEAFAAFITVLMFVGASTLVWHTVMLIVNAAHEGAAISQRWSGVWTTSRLFFGAGMLTPYVKGYCLANVLVLYAAMWSGSLGNIIYSAYINGLTIPAVATTATLPAVTPTMRSLVIHDLCYNIEKLQASRAAAAGATSSIQIPQSLSTPTVSSAGSSGSNYAYRLNRLLQSPTATGASANTTNANQTTPAQLETWDFGSACGSVSITITDPNDGSIFATYSQSELNAYQSFLNGIDTTIATIVNKDIGADDTVSSSYTSDVASVVSAYQKGVSTLYNSMSTAAYALLNGVNGGSMTNMVNGAKTYGWASAGSFYMNLSRMQGLLDEFLAISPEAQQESTNPAQNAVADRELESLYDDSSVYKDFAQTIENAISQTTTTTSSALSASNSLTSGSGAGSIYSLDINTNNTNLSNPSSTVGEIFTVVSNWVGKYLNNFISWTTGSGTISGDGSNSEASGSELEKMTEFGQNILALCYTVMLITAGASLASVLGGGGMFAKAGEAAIKKMLGEETIGRILSILTWVFGALLTVGATHAYILPMMPYIQSVFFIMSMIIFVVEAMVAAPIWALMHFRLDGQQFVGEQQKAGYVMMFNLFLRIPVAVLGMLVSVSVFNAAILVMSITYYPAVQSGTGGGGGPGIIGTLIMMGIMTYLHYQLAIRSFGLMSHIPSQIGSWFGASTYNEGNSNESSAVRALIGAQAASGLGMLFNNATGGGGGAPRNGSNQSPGRGLRQATDGGQGAGGAGGDGDSPPSAGGDGDSPPSASSQGVSPGSSSSRPQVPNAWSMVSNNTLSSPTSQGAVAALGAQGANSLMSAIGQVVQNTPSGNPISDSAVSDAISNWSAGQAEQGAPQSDEQMAAARQLADHAIQEHHDLSG